MVNEKFRARVAFGRAKIGLKRKIFATRAISKYDKLSMISARRAGRGRECIITNMIF